VKALIDLPSFRDIATQTEIWTKIPRQIRMPAIAFVLLLCRDVLLPKTMVTAIKET